MTLPPPIYSASLHDKESPSGDTSDDESVFELIDGFCSTETTEKNSPGTEPRLLEESIKNGEESLPKETQSEETSEVSKPTELELLRRSIERLESRENLATSATLCAKFSDISKLTDACVFSPLFKVTGLDWGLVISRNDEHLKVMLGLVSTNLDQCTASYHVKLTSSTGPALTRPSDASKDDKLCFKKGSNSWIIDRFISFEDLLSASNGYLNAEDDSISLEVYLTVHSSVHRAPAVSCRNPKKEIKKEGEIKKDEQILPTEPSLECECTIL